MHEHPFFPFIFFFFPPFLPAATETSSSLQSLTHTSAAGGAGAVPQPLVRLEAARDSLVLGDRGSDVPHGTPTCGSQPPGSSSSDTSWKTGLGLMLGSEPGKAQGGMPDPRRRFASAAPLAGVVGACKGAEAVMPEIWQERWIPAALHP